MTGNGVRNGALACAVLALAASLASPAAADAWRYTDERGVVHFTDQPTHVPERYQGGLESVAIRRGPDADPGDGDGDSAREETTAHATPRKLSAFEERLLAQAEADWNPQEMEEIQGWMDTWGIAFMLSGIPWGVVVFACWIHSVVRRRFVWMATNVFFWAVSIPLYILLRLDPLGVPARVGILLLWSAPMLVGGLGAYALMETMGGLGSA